jgi:hypothetical protein
LTDVELPEAFARRDDDCAGESSRSGLTRASYSRVPLRVLGEGSRASERTEVVGLLVHEQATNRVIWIDRHLSDGVDRQVIGVLAHANDSGGAEPGLGPAHLEG